MRIFPSGAPLPGGQAHGGAVRGGPLRDQLRRRLSGDSEVELVLDEGVEGPGGLAVFIIVIATLLEHIGDLLIGPALAGPDLPDALQQLVEVVPAEGAAVFQHLIVEDEALLDVFLQRFGGPLAEPGGLLGVHPIAHGDDGVQVVVLQGAADLPGALLTNHRDFLGSCLRRQLLLSVDVFQMQEMLSVEQSNSSAMPLWVSQKVSS